MTKFKHLWFAGFKATLTIEADNGEASIILKTGLGVIQPPQQGSDHGLDAIEDQLIIAAK